jgi:predicted lipoprotein with Yx(FWY)xxD motif
MRLLRATPLVLGLGIFLAACSGGGATAAPTAAAPTDAPASVEPSAPAETPSDGTAGVSVAVSSTSLGDILVDGEGMTLYAFTPDTGGTPTCYDDCAAAWPPLTADAVPSLGAGLDAGDFTLVDRTDGGKQVAVNGWPLYYFASDAAAGDTNGQGVGGKWYVVDAAGKLVGAPTGRSY